MPPDIATIAHCNVGAGALDDKILFDRRCTFDSLVGIGFHRDVELGAAHAGVLSDDRLALGVVDAGDKAVGAERTKHNRVHRADTRTG